MSRYPYTVTVLLYPYIVAMSPYPYSAPGSRSDYVSRATWRQGSSVGPGEAAWDTTVDSSEAS